MSARFHFGSVLFLALAACCFAAAQEEGKKGTVIGVVTDRGKNFVEVKADGEEKARRYTAHIVKEGSTDKATLDMLPTVPIGTRVKIDWLFAERPRVIKMEILKTAEKDK